ncbi:DUF1236 domain-containing protein [Methylopila sp. M107]|uniref:DUF1236 domain-containing protein n=1 Tax=Methylopila sp. M107 TaxID=1101190 RepID=UPI00035CD065|nr:DUF1236 domain-containing protein [Methylopila sp. M107]
MRIALAAAALSAFVVSVPGVASAQGVVIEERRDPEIVVREPEERVIVREPRERVVEEERVQVRRAPDSVRRYVIEERRPSVRYERRVVVGDVLPDDVELHDVPDSDYGYTVLNGRRVVVDDNRRVVDEFD